MKRILTICFFFIALSSHAQEMWGISNSNFAGNMGIFLNPSSFIGAPYRNEVNFLAADIYAENTYVYFPASENIVLTGIFGTVPPGKRYLNDNSIPRQKGFGHALVIGPSYLANKESYGWGIHSALRSELSALNVPIPLAQSFYDNWRLPEYYGIKQTAGPLSSAQATWIEIGGTYGKVLKESNERYLKAAATVNILLGMHGYYLDARTMDFTPIDSANWLFHNVDGTFAHAFNDQGGSVLGIRGLGASTTVGLTFIRKRNPAAFDCTYKNDQLIKYKYRLGVSLLDFGFIHMSGQAKVTTISTTSDRFWANIDSAKGNSFVHLDSLLLQNIGGTTQDQSFSILVPTALSVQFDYQVRPNVFTNMSIVQRIHYKVNEIARPNQINLSARYERRRYEANLNLSVWEYKYPSLGLAFRYRWLVVGTDRLFQFVGLTNVKAFDFFFGFKYQFCDSPFGSRKKDCPAYN